MKISPPKVGPTDRPIQKPTNGRADDEGTAAASLLFPRVASTSFYRISAPAAGEQGRERERAWLASPSLSPIVGSSNLISAGFLPPTLHAEAAAAINHSLLSPPSFLTYSLIPRPFPVFNLVQSLPPARLKERPPSPPPAPGPALN